MLYNIKKNYLVLIKMSKFVENLKCEHENCTRDARKRNVIYHPDKWLCNLHSNEIIREVKKNQKKNN